MWGLFAGKYLKPYQGLKLTQLLESFVPIPSRKIPKTLSGIETSISSSSPTDYSRKIPKTLSGIETDIFPNGDTTAAVSAGKYLKPYQGLKLVLV